MLSVEDAVARVRAGFTVLPAERVALADGLGRVLADDVAARLSHPPKAVSAMDGYAVKAADVKETPMALTLIGQSQAGAGFEGTLQSGQTVRIFTGAPVPDGADAVVMQENTEADDGEILILEPVATGRDVRSAGLDFSEGDVLLEAGTVLSARDIGLAAAMNVPELNVRRRPVVAYCSTGDEVVMPGAPVGPDQIISSNSLALGAYIEVFGGQSRDLGIAGDSEESLRETLTGARGADLLITTGGASVGDYDVVARLMGDAKADLGFYKVAMRPGKPIIFGRIDGIPLLGLPGNPVSAGVTSFIFVKAAMAVMLGIPDRDERITAYLDTDLPANGMRQDYLRATLSSDAAGNLVATPFSAQDSSMLARLAAADCLILRPPKAAPANAGDTVEIVPLRRGSKAF